MVPSDWKLIMAPNGVRKLFRIKLWYSRVIADIVNASLRHWLSLVIELVIPSILGHVILLRFILV